MAQNKGERWQNDLVRDFPQNKTQINEKKTKLTK